MINGYNTGKTTNNKDILNLFLQAFEFRDATLIIGGMLAMNICGALTYGHGGDQAKQESGHSLKSGLKAPVHILEAISYKKQRPINIQLPSLVAHDSLKESLIQIRRPALIVYFLSTLLWNGSFSSLLAFLYNYIVLTFESPFWAGIAMTLNGVGLLALSVLMACLNLKFDTNKYAIQLISLLLMSLCTCAMGFVHSVYAVVTLSCVYGGMFGIVLSNIPNIVKHLNGTRSHDVMYAISQMCGGLGSLVAPPLIAKLQQHLPLSILFLFSAGFSLLSCALMFTMLLVDRSLWQPFEAHASSEHVENRSESAS